MIFETFRQAIQNVWSNKLRTFLTMLGIIIGVMAVIVIVGLGNGMTKSMRDSFFGTGHQHPQSPLGRPPLDASPPPPPPPGPPPCGASPPPAFRQWGGVPDHQAS